ncbi:VOC family protein [Staphylococcus taiwanensis]|nr:VOC family protein [Staphylococcus taiwanensis]
MEIKNLDHLVLTVSNIDDTVDFYSNVLGMEKIQFGDNRTALKFGNQKINLHHVTNIIKPSASNPKPGSADLCFITETHIEEVEAQLKQHRVPIELGPVNRTGAMGDILSIYVRDSDNNLIEISNYKHE